MSMSVGGFNSNFNISAKTFGAKTPQSGSASPNETPVFDHGRVWGSLDGFGNGLKSYQKEWEGVYSERFSGQDNGGKMSVDEVKEMLQSEFSQFGVRFVNSNPKDVVDGQHKVYIDDTNMQKMANDPAYRGKVMALMQRELTCTQQGYSFQRGGDTINSTPLTGTVISICQENTAYGGIPYAGMARGAPSISQTTSTTKGGKSMLEIMKEIQEEQLKKLEEKKEKEKLEAEKKESELDAGMDIETILETGGNVTSTETVTGDSGDSTSSPSGGTLDVVG